jgi:hypothetical protein
MDIDYAFICDYAQALGNKVNALGIGFNTIFSQTIPAIHQMFHLVIQLRAGTLEAGTKEVKVHLIDADGGNVIQPIKGQINIVIPRSGEEATARLVMAFNNVTFPKYGAYSLHLDIEGQEKVRIPLKVCQPPSKESSQPPQE